jgi:hypothetical protein
MAAISTGVIAAHDISYRSRNHVTPSVLDRELRLGSNNFFLTQVLGWQWLMAWGLKSGMIWHPRCFQQEPFQSVANDG